MPTLKIVLDTNEYIFGLSKQLSACTALLEKLFLFKIKIPRIILDELHRNLPGDLLKNFYSMIIEAGAEIIEKKVPINLVKKYENVLPQEDAVIAAYCEYLKVDVFISENRHFLEDFKPKAFTVLSAKDFLEQYVSEL